MRAVFLFVLAACGSQVASPKPLPIATVATPTVSALPEPPQPGSTRDRIVRFANARGGLHGEPARMPYRTVELRGAECWLFFVGGAEAAHAAWLATPWDPAWGKATKRLPHVDAQVQAPLLEDGVVFERVDEWPRAVRVVSTSQAKTGVVVNLESLAARNQPAGLKGAFVVEDQKVSGSMPVASPVAEERPAIDEKIATAAVKLASASKAALAGSLAPNAEIFETSQHGLSRKSPLAAWDITPPVFDAVKLAATTVCDRTGTCIDNAGIGAVVVLSGGVAKIARVIIAPSHAAAIQEPAPTPIAPDDALVAFRMNETAQGEVRAITSVAIGSKKLLVVRDDQFVYVVELDGAYSRVSQVFYERVEKSTFEARVVDVTNDGIADVVLFARWPKAENATAFDLHSGAIAAIRSNDLDGALYRDKLGIEIDLLGARDLDDAVAHATSPVKGAQATNAEACAVLAASTTPAGLVANSIATARIVSFDEPMQPASATRAVPVTRAKADDAAQLKDACNDPSEGGFKCRGGLCGNLDYGLGNMFRFVRVGRTLKLETALVYTGS